MTLGRRAKSAAFIRCSYTHHFYSLVLFTPLGLVLSVGTQTDPVFFSFWRTLYISMVFLFGRPKRCRQKASLSRVFSTAVNKPSIFSDPYFAVMRKILGFKPAFKPVAINLDYSVFSFNSFNSVLVDCFWSRQNSFHLTTFLKRLIAISMLDWTGFRDVSGTNRSKVPLHTCWAMTSIFGCIPFWQNKSLIEQKLLSEPAFIWETHKVP